jgi:PhnB protein
MFVWLSNEVSACRVSPWLLFGRCVRRAKPPQTSGLKGDGHGDRRGAAVSGTTLPEAGTIRRMTSEDSMRQPTVQAQLSVRNGRAAVEFYKAAFGAVEVYRFGGNDDLVEVVAQVAVGNSLFWVEDESPSHGNFSPQTVGGATTRMLLIVDDPTSVLERAVAAGASLINPVSEEHGWHLGRIDDPFGHRWEIGKPISAWPPPDTHPTG